MRAWLARMLLLVWPAARATAALSYCSTVYTPMLLGVLNASERSCKRAIAREAQGGSDQEESRLKSLDALRVGAMPAARAPPRGLQYRGTARATARRHCEHAGAHT